MLRREDLEDCHAQATLELLAQVQRGHAFAGDAHIANTLEMRMVSRIRDMRRAIAGRSPIRSALASAVPISAGEPRDDPLVDRRADLEALVLVRSELTRVVVAASELSVDQRRVLVHQIGGGGCAAFCRCHGWSPEKYRKVAQRGRARLRELLDSDGAPVPPRGGATDQKPGPAYDIPRSPTHRPALGSGAGRR
jgi:DNA-directed RNA polymerase specialized sigma24 family protein